MIAANGTIYIGDISGRLTALHPDGSKKWVEKVDGHITFSPALCEDGTILIGTSYVHSFYDDYGIYAVAPNGSTLWSKEGLELRSEITVGPDGTIYAVINDHSKVENTSDMPYAGLIALHQNGSEIWRYDGYAQCGASPALGPSGEVIFSKECGLTVLNANGSLKWHVEIDVVEEGSYSSHNSEPAVQDGIIYVANGPRLLAFSMNGTELWRADVPTGRVWYPPTILSDGQVIVLSGRDICSFTPNGSFKWRFSVDEELSYSNLVASGDGNLILTTGNNIYCLSGQGDVIWHHTVDIIGNDGTLYVISDPWTLQPAYLYAIDCAPANWILIVSLVLIIAALTSIGTIGVFLWKRCRGGRE